MKMDEHIFPAALANNKVIQGMANKAENPYQPFYLGLFDKSLLTFWLPFGARDPKMIGSNSITFLRIINGVQFFFPLVDNFVQILV